MYNRVKKITTRIKQVKKQRTILPHPVLNNIVFSVFRFIIYGMTGVFAEVCQYTIVKIGKAVPLLEWAFRYHWKVDDRLQLNTIWEVPWYTFYGQCSLWMFPVYGFAILLVLERVFKLSKTLNLIWIVRGALYSVAIMFFELITGFIVSWITGYRIWYYDDTGNIFHMTSVYLFFVWFVTGLFAEFIYKELMGSSLRNKSVKLIETVVELEPILKNKVGEIVNDKSYYS